MSWQLVMQGDDERVKTATIVIHGSFIGYEKNTIHFLRFSFTA